jgi:hypothetical protein
MLLTIGLLGKALTPDSIHKLVRRYSADLGFEICAHALRSTAVPMGSPSGQLARYPRPQRFRHE